MTTVKKQYLNGAMGHHSTRVSRMCVEKHVCGCVDSACAFDCMVEVVCVHLNAGFLQLISRLLCYPKDSIFFCPESRLLPCFFRLWRDDLKKVYC